jgi:tetratricopeptide (TPR) repeat protein
MKILRWLLSHFFLILLIVVVIYGYMFWGNLLGKETPAGKAIAYLSSEFVEVADFVNAVKAKQAQLNAGKTSPQSPSGSNDVIGSDVAETVEMVGSDAAVEPTVDDKRTMGHTAINRQATNPQSERQAQVNAQPNERRVPVVAMQLKRDEIVSDGNKLPATVNDRDLGGAFVSPEIERQLENVNDQGKVVDDTQRSEAVRASWITARRSFYQRKYDLSEQSYRNVIDNTEDNFDAYGELGNVYFNQGKKQQAAAAYFEAAAILVRKGQIDRAKSMVGLLNILDKGRAVELQKLIDSAVS